ncbi:MAG: hypothetical protein JKY34_04120 [Kordiimonadaceae bacterium]|nr:hypothetical protein [Kordiimonadaceae bacterium]
MFRVSYGDTSLESQMAALGILEKYQENLTKATAYAKQLCADGMPAFITPRPGDADMAPMMELASHISLTFTDLIILGTGGSSLGAQAALAIARFKSGRSTRIHTPDSLDAYELDSLFRKLVPSNTHVLTISKSGTTGETLAQLLACRSWIEAASHPASMADHFSFITEPGDRALRTYGETLGSVILDHATDIGGRFSVLSNVGMLPVAVAGLSVSGFCQGAQSIFQTFCEDPEHNAAIVGAALIHTLNQTRGVTQILTMPYAESMRAFTRWHSQLWAESVGKDGRGTTPIRAVGPVDQHSQLQLYLDGPDDKFYTIITIPSYGKGPRIDANEAKRYGLDYMANRTIGDMVTCQSRATQDSLRKQGRLVREIIATKVDEENLGSLFASFMLETIITAHLMGVNAYDQPAVEEGKILTRQYLANLTGQETPSQA